MCVPLTVFLLGTNSKAWRKCNIIYCNSSSKRNSGLAFAPYLDIRKSPPCRMSSERQQKQIDIQLHMQSVVGLLDTVPHAADCCFVSHDLNSYSASHNNWCTETLLNRVITAQWEGMGDVGAARYEPALLPPCPTIWVLSYSNCQRSAHSSSRAQQFKCYTSRKLCRMCAWMRKPAPTRILASRIYSLTYSPALIAWQDKDCYT